jgi:O-antigen/teichoic acid export membrane protein
LPAGTLVVGVGLLVAGVSAYGFVALSTRVLGEVRYGPLGALWALVFLAGPGLFLPVEQEVSRAIAARRARRLGGAPVVRRAAIAGAGLLLAVLIVLGGTSRWAVDHIFDQQLLLLTGLALGLAAALAAHLTRGCLSGTGNFRGYGTFIGADGFIRFLGCALLALIGVRTAGLYGIALGIAGLLAVPVALRVQRPRLEEGPESSWSEINTALGYLLMASLCAYGIMNIGPVLVQGLASPAEADLAGRFLPAVIVSRIPLFLFQAVQAALLPKLAGLASAGRLGDFRNGLRRLLVVVAGLAVVGTIGGWAIGPFVVKIMSGPQFELSHRTLGLLAAGSGFYMLALAVAQAVIALGGHRDQAVGWVAGLGVLLLTAWVASDDLYLRVELALLCGSLAALCVMTALLVRRLSAVSQAAVEVEAGDILDPLHDVAMRPTAVEA